MVLRVLLSMVVEYFEAASRIGVTRKSECVEVAIVSLTSRACLFALVEDRLEFVVIACLNNIEDVVTVTCHISGLVPHFLGNKVGAQFKIEFYTNTSKSKKDSL